MNEWQPISTLPPDYGDSFDVWIAYRDKDTGLLRGHRLVNCWYGHKMILQGEGAQQVLAATHWMTVAGPDQ